MIYFIFNINSWPMFISADRIYMELNIIELEKKYLVDVLGKKLINSDERDDRKYPRGYVVLARKYWPEEFMDDAKKHVHHLDFNPRNNVVSNLVVLTPKEHRNIHKLFDPKHEIAKQKIGEASKSYMNTLAGKELAARTGHKNKGSHKVWNEDHTEYHMEH